MPTINPYTMKKILTPLLLVLITTAVLAQTEKIDLSVIQQIRKEGLENSQVMDIAFQLTDVSGNRLTNSPGYMRAANFVSSKLNAWGLQNVAIDPWGEFGKGWVLDKKLPRHKISVL